MSIYACMLNSHIMHVVQKYVKNVKTGKGDVNTHISLGMWERKCPVVAVESAAEFGG